MAIQLNSNCLSSVFVDAYYLCLLAQQNEDHQDIDSGSYCNFL